MVARASSSSASRMFSTEPAQIYAAGRLHTRAPDFHSLPQLCSFSLTFGPFSMSVSLSPSFRRPRSLSIDSPPTLRDYVTATSSSRASSARREPWCYASPSGESFERICSVICLYDFSSSDSDHLSFRKDEVLNIVRKEESGWWAAVRGDASEVGWVPASYVHTLSDDAAEEPYTVLEKTKIPEDGADQESVTSSSLFSTRAGDTPPSPGATFYDDAPPDMTQNTEPTSPSSSIRSDPPSVTSKSHDIPLTEDLISLPDSEHRETENTPTSSDSSFALSSTSQSAYLPLRLDKSLPASPLPITPSSGDIGSKFSVLSGGAIDLQDRNRRRRPVLLDDQSSLQRLSAIIQARSSDHLLDPVSPPKPPPPPSPSVSPFLPYAQPRPGKILQLTGDDSAQAFHNAKQAQANLPWYLKHQHGEEEIKLEFDGTVKAGTLPALVEHLVVDPLLVSQQEMFRRSFLVTFRTFATSTEVFDLLVAQYELEVPQNLTEEEFDHWRREKLRPTQKRVLIVLTMWLEDYDLLNQDPEVAPKLQSFLSLIISPATLALTARHMLKSLERLTFAEPVALEAVIMPPKKWKKVWKENLELVRMDPMELAQHISLFESMLYRKIRAQECFLWTKTKEGDTVKNIQAFCATHDWLGDWVKCSILEVDVLGKRANVLDFWIRVAEKCRSLNNFSSMSSIVAALSSALVSRLHFTWLNSSKEPSLEPLRKVIHPASNYGYYRGILEAIEGPCIPFVGPFLKNIAYAQEQHADNVVVQSVTKPDRQFTLIHFVKRQKWYEITLQMLRFQAKPYLIPEIPEMTNFITSQMTRAVAKEERWFWQRSDELQRAELFHADIKKGLQAAGF